MFRNIDDGSMVVSYAGRVRGGGRKATVWCVYVRSNRLFLTLMQYAASIRFHPLLSKVRRTCVSNCLLVRKRQSTSKVYEKACVRGCEWRFDVDKLCMVPPSFEIIN